MPLYRIHDQKVQQLKASRFSLERQLQQLCEENLEELFGVKFIASEFSTGTRQSGRIDTLGLDQDGSPTIIEYKRSKKDNIINQGLFYLDWLVDHRGDFVISAQEAFGNDVSRIINWDHPRLILVAEEFTEYDKYAVNRIGANIELWTYRLYDEHLILLDPLFATQSRQSKSTQEDMPVLELGDLEDQAEDSAYDFDHHLNHRSEQIHDLFYALREGILKLGGGDSEIVETVNKLYIGYRHGKNFVEVQPQSRGLKLFLDIPIEELSDPHGFARDVTSVGHWGTGDVEIKLQNPKDLDYTLDLIEQSYNRTL